MLRFLALARYALLLACLLLAILLLSWKPEREVSALLIVTAYLGMCLFIWSRQRQDAPAAIQPSADNLLIAYASQSGHARKLAELSAEQLRAAGIVTDLLPLNALHQTALAKKRRAVFIVSTYGEGEAPDNAAHFERRLSKANGDLSSLEFAMLALGDRQYTHFCGFARRLDTKLRQLGARPLFDRLEVDRADAGTLRHWQHQLGHLSGHTDFTDWQPAPYQPWRLESRQLLNPGSLGAAIYQLALCPAGPMPHWQAGDIVEIGPRHPPAEVEKLLRQAGLDPSQTVGDGQTLAAALGSKRLPSDLAGLRGLDIEALLALPPLPHREYSIASVPVEGRIVLLVRETRHADGRLGLGSGWLCRHATLGGDIDLRVRSNPGFHGPQPQVPVILIGSGTGMAGLRAHLRERAAAPTSRNWLLFGERSAAHDQLLHDELQGWLAAGHLQRLDLAFSRDQAQKVYVQHLLRDSADDLRQWIARGASLYVCGSLEGMGREVQQILSGVLGEGQLRKLADEGRYRRDLY